MTYTVTITSQGQITIPAAARRELRLDKVKKAFIKVEDQKMVLTPAADILELEGIFKSKKKIAFRKIRESFGKYLARHAIRRLR